MKKETGHTLIEVFIAMLGASMAGVFIISTYLISIRHWNRYQAEADTIRFAWLLYQRTNSIVRNSTGIVPSDLPSQWKAGQADGTDIEIKQVDDTLIIGDKKLSTLHKARLNAFDLAVQSDYGVNPVVQCSLSCSALSRRTTFKWQTVCRGQSTSRTIPQAMAERKNNGNYYWDKIDDVLIP